MLGIETTCDDTGIAVLDPLTGSLLSEVLVSQKRYSKLFGGVVPWVARDLHARNIEAATLECLRKANVAPKDLTAVAVSIMPGLSGSLKVGLCYAKHICTKYNLPLIPIHHMEAHALVIRHFEHVEFPFLTLLISGGHALLAVVSGVGDVQLLGSCLDQSPGDCYDKVGRLISSQIEVPNEFSNLSFGEIVDRLGSLAHLGLDNLQDFYDITVDTDSACNFSFAGLTSYAMKHISGREIPESKRITRLPGESSLEHACRICFAFQSNILRQIASRCVKGLEYSRKSSLLPPENNALVVSGGVASNNFLIGGLKRCLSHNSCSVKVPPTRYCTDNGVMVAWNGYEKWRLGLNVFYPKDFEAVVHLPTKKATFGAPVPIELKNFRVPRLSSYYLKHLRNYLHHL